MAECSALGKQALSVAEQEVINTDNSINFKQEMIHINGIYAFNFVLQYVTKARRAQYTDRKLATGRTQLLQRIRPPINRSALYVRGEKRTTMQWKLAKNAWRRNR